MELDHARADNSIKRCCSWGCKFSVSDQIYKVANESALIFYEEFFTWSTADWKSSWICVIAPPWRKSFLTINLCVANCLIEIYCSHQPSNGQFYRSSNGSLFSVFGCWLFRALWEEEKLTAIMKWNLREENMLRYCVAMAEEALNFIISHFSFPFNNKLLDKLSSFFAIPLLCCSQFSLESIETSRRAAAGEEERCVGTSRRLHFLHFERSLRITLFHFHDKIRSSSNWNSKSSIYVCTRGDEERIWYLFFSLCVSTVPILDLFRNADFSISRMPTGKDFESEMLLY